MSGCQLTDNELVPHGVDTAMKTGVSERDQATATLLLDRIHRAVAVKVVVGDVWPVSPDISQTVDGGPNRMPALCAPTALTTASMTSSTNRT